MIEDRVGIGVADDDPRRIGTLFLEDAELGEADVGQDGVGRDGQPGRARRPGGRSVDTLLGRRDPRLVGPDLADDPRPHAGLPHSLGRLADQLVGQVVGRAAVDARLGRVVGGAIPAAAHDDVEVTGRRESDQPRRVPPDAGERQVDQPAPARLPEARELGEDHRLVAGQLPVIPAALDVPQGDLGVLVRQRETERIRLDGTEDRLDVGHGGRCYAVARASGALGAPAVIVRAPSSSSTMAIARRSRSAGR